jgi:3-hydroxybutyryl-CoA dehydratase
MKIGDRHQETIIITDELIKKFAEFSGDFNPIHFEDECAKAQGFNGRIAHGMVSASYFSKIFASTFPGPGAVYLSQSFKFHAPVYVNDEITFELEVVDQRGDRPIFTIKTSALGKNSELKISGEAVIRANLK